jgi:hypothetical protein
LPATTTDSGFTIVSSKDGQLLERSEALWPHDLIINRARKRAICESGNFPRRFVLCSFKNVMQEDYETVLDNVSRVDAWAWLRGADTETFGRSADGLARSRAIKRAHDIKDIVAKARAHGQDEAADFILSAWENR